MLKHFQGLVMIHMVELPLELVTQIQQTFELLGCRELVVLLKLEELFHLLCLQLQLHHNLLRPSQSLIGC